MSRKNAITLLTLAALSGASIAGSARAGDLNPPPWPRGTPDTTFQAWTFPTPSAPTPADPGFFNPNGVPFMGLTGNPVWQPQFAGFNGVWCLSQPTDSLDFRVPNKFDPLSPKDIWIQVKYWEPVPAVGNLDILVVPDGLAALAVMPFLVTSYPIGPAGSGWNQGVFQVQLPYCPNFEDIVIKSHLPGAVLYIDQVVIDTRCIPTPGSLALFAGAGLIGMRRRRA